MIALVYVGAVMFVAGFIFGFVLYPLEGDDE